MLEAQRRKEKHHESYFFFLMKSCQTIAAAINFSKKKKTRDGFLIFLIDGGIATAINDPPFTIKR
jgi:hypothetical protein